MRLHLYARLRTWWANFRDRRKITMPPITIGTGNIALDVGQPPLHVMLMAASQLNAVDLRDSEMSKNPAGWSAADLAADIGQIKASAENLTGESIEAIASRNYEQYLKAHACRQPGCVACYSQAQAIQDQAVSQDQLGPRLIR